MIYTITISPAIDYVVHLEELIPGATNRSEKEEYYFGGKGINVSIILKELGIDSKALGFVSGFTGYALEDGLREEGIHTDFVHLASGITRINIKIKSAEETEINGQGAIASKEDFDKLVEKLSKLAKDDILVLSGSIPAALPQDTYTRLLGIVNQKEVLVILDAAGELLLSALPQRPFLVKPNIDELKDLFGEEVRPLEGAKRLQVLGARNVIVSLGSKGAVLLTEEGDIHTCGTCNGQVLNTVGSGDSMVAGFVAGYVKSKDYQYALELGSAAGSATALSPGLAKREEIENCLKELRKE